VLRASFWLAPWLSTRPCDLPEDKTRDASDQLLPPERSACTRTSCVPGSRRGFHRVDTPRSLGLRAAYQGTECFTALVNASADRSWTRAAYCLFSAYRLALVRGVERGRFLPTAPVAIEPLTPLSRPSLPRNLSVRLRAAFERFRLFRVFFAFSVVRKPPRPP